MLDEILLVEAYTFDIYAIDFEQPMIYCATPYLE